MVDARTARRKKTAPVHVESLGPWGGSPQTPRPTLPVPRVSRRAASWPTVSSGGVGTAQLARAHKGSKLNVPAPAELREANAVSSSSLVCGKIARARKGSKANVPAPPGLREANTSLAGQVRPHKKQLAGA